MTPQRPTGVHVGSVVRTKRPLYPKATGRAMVATIQANGDDDDDSGSKHDSKADGNPAATLTSVTLLWEGLAPQAVLDVGRSSSRRSTSNFLVAPKMLRKTMDDNNDDEEECTVPLDEVQELLPFELDSFDGQDDDVGTWKDRGDQLLKLGDASAATSFYEEALFRSSQLSVGATIVVAINGFPKMAEVDCIEEDDALDITLVETGTEQRIPQKSVMLTLLDDDPEKLQERILLNLTRCMLQLSEMDASNRNLYAKSAVLGATLVITIATYRNNGRSNNNKDQDGVNSAVNAQTALVLRAKAYTTLSKFAHAMADAGKLVKAGNSQGQKLLTVVERKKKMQQKTNKKLAKEMCKLVGEAAS